MNRALRMKLNHTIASVLSVVLLLCLMGAGDISDAFEFYITSLQTQTSVTDTVELEWKEQESNVLRCVPYMGNNLRTRTMTIGKNQRARFRQMGYAFFVALFSVLLKVTAISYCFLLLKCLYFKIYDIQTIILCFLHNQDGKKRCIPIFLQVN